MDSQHNEQTLRLERDLNNLGIRFDRHLEIYAQNGKELAALKAQVNITHTNFDDKLNTIILSINNHVDESVSKTELDPIKRIVYGTVALVLTAVVVAIVGLVIKN